jgi:hypothetical protein
MDKLREQVSRLTVEGDLRREVSMNIRADGGCTLCVCPVPWRERLGTRGRRHEPCRCHQDRRHSHQMTGLAPIKL